MRKSPKKTQKRTAKASQATKATPSKATKATKSRRTAKSSGDPPAMDPRFAEVAEAFAKDRAVTVGRMMSSFGLKVGGKIFAMLSRDAFVAKLPKARVDDLVRAKKGVYFDPRKDGRLMKEWISIADRRAPWLELAKEAYRFVKTGL
jgi:TfoX/Sxy family transcriptional regulator of competence genes